MFPIRLWILNDMYDTENPRLQKKAAGIIATGLNGTEIAERIPRAEKATPVINPMAVTSEASSNDARTFLRISSFSGLKYVSA